MTTLVYPYASDVLGINCYFDYACSTLICSSWLKKKMHVCISSDPDLLTDDI